MNSVVVLLAFFVLGLQNFDGNTGITPVFAPASNNWEGLMCDDNYFGTTRELSDDVCKCVNALINECQNTNTEYMRGVIYMNDLQDKVGENCPSIPADAKSTAISCLEGLANDAYASEVITYLNNK